jgi:hypothetical protein
MSDNKTAYTYYINPNGSGNTNGAGNTASSASTSTDQSNSVHQTSPAWVLTFLRWAVRDTLRTKPTITSNYSTIVAAPLVVENDCVQLGVADSKSVLTPSMSATLLMTDVNYETEVAPGDFVFVNILNWESEARRVANQARNLDPINGIHDGFKGFFKVQSVRKTLLVDPESGIKAYAVKITGFAFSEFNNSIYFNPNLINNTTDRNLQLYLTNIKKDWDNLQTNKGLNDIQGMVQFLIKSFVGEGFSDNNRKTNTIAPITTNTHFFMPSGVDDLLGLPEVQAAKDAFNYIFGIQQYAAQAPTVAQGMNPIGATPTATTGSRFIILPNHVEGTSYIKPEYWNQVKAWSILNQFTNSPLNELYTCFRISPDGSVLPTMVFRQIPFTNDNFVTGSSFNVTRFMSLPRWNVSPALAFSFDLGRDDALRLNFMQYYGIPVNSPQELGIAVETSRQNYVYDIDDVKRNGLRPSVITSEFDFLSKDQNAQYRSAGWAKIVGDALIGGHLKMSGTIVFVGLPEPIAVGDNLQFDGVVYHIEQISHNASVQPQTGKKIFRTTVVVSNGLDIESGTNVIYNEMKYGSAYDKRTADYNQSQILPGVSESQDTFYRKINPDTPISGGQSFVEPNTNTSISKPTRDS